VILRGAWLEGLGGGLGGALFAAGAGHGAGETGVRRHPGKLVCVRGGEGGGLRGRRAWGWRFGGLFLRGWLGLILGVEGGQEGFGGFGGDPGEAEQIQGLGAEIAGQGFAEGLQGLFQRIQHVRREEMAVSC